MSTTPTATLRRPGPRRLWIALIVVLLLVAGAGGYVAWQGQRAAAQLAAANGPAVVGDGTVLMSGFAFATPHVQIPAGETVTWSNRDTAEHNIVFDGGSPAPGPLLAQGESYSQTFTEPGTYTYYCEPHPFMVGRVTVVQP